MSESATFIHNFLPELVLIILLIQALIKSKRDIEMIRLTENLQELTDILSQLGDE